MVPDHFKGMPYDHFQLTESQRKDVMTIDFIALLIGMAVFTCAIIYEANQSNGHKSVSSERSASRYAHKHN